MSEKFLFKVFASEQDIQVLYRENFFKENIVVRGHQLTIFVTVNGIEPLGGKGVQLKSAKIFTFVTKIEISNISLSIVKE